MTGEWYEFNPDCWEHTIVDNDECLFSGIVQPSESGSGFDAWMNDSSSESGMVWGERTFGTLEDGKRYIEETAQGGNIVGKRKKAQQQYFSFDARYDDGVFVSCGVDFDFEDGDPDVSFNVYNDVYELDSSYDVMSVDDCVDFTFSVLGDNDIIPDNDEDVIEAVKDAYYSIFGTLTPVAKRKKKAEYGSNLNWQEMNDSFGHHWHADMGDYSYDILDDEGDFPWSEDLSTGDYDTARSLEEAQRDCEIHYLEKSQGVKLPRDYWGNPIVSSKRKKALRVDDFIQPYSDDAGYLKLELGNIILMMEAIDDNYDNWCWFASDMTSDWEDSSGGFSSAEEALENMENVLLSEGIYKNLSASKQARRRIAQQVDLATIPQNELEKMAIRSNMKAENDAILSYDKFIQRMPQSSDIRSGLEDIRDEEKKHLGELYELLLKADPTEAKFFTDGGSEVTSSHQASFASDISNLSEQNWLDVWDELDMYYNTDRGATNWANTHPALYLLWDSLGGNMLSYSNGLSAIAKKKGNDMLDDAKTTELYDEICEMLLDSQTDEVEMMFGDLLDNGVSRDELESLLFMVLSDQSFAPYYNDATEIELDIKNMLDSAYLYSRKNASVKQSKAYKKMAASAEDLAQTVIGDLKSDAPFESLDEVNVYISDDIASNLIYTEDILSYASQYIDDNELLDLFFSELFDDVYNALGDLNRFVYIAPEGRRKVADMVAYSRDIAYVTKNGKTISQHGEVRVSDSGHVFWSNSAGGDGETTIGDMSDPNYGDIDSAIDLAVDTLNKMMDEDKDKRSSISGVSIVDDEKSLISYTDGQRLF